VIAANGGGRGGCGEPPSGASLLGELGEAILTVGVLVGEAAVGDEANGCEPAFLGVEGAGGDDGTGTAAVGGVEGAAGVGGATKGVVGALARSTAEGAMGAG